jgi:hypothetical protein
LPEYLQYVDIVLNPDDNRIVSIEDESGNRVDPQIAYRPDGRMAYRLPARFSSLDPRSLPSWDALSDVDKGCVLMFLHKVEAEGSDYAKTDYPAKFVDNAELVALSPDDASDYALGFEDQHSAESVLDDGGDLDEWHRLYDLAYAATRHR